MASSQSDSCPSVDWEALGSGPGLAYHVGCLVDGFLYLHGGISSSGSSVPLAGFYKLDIKTGVYSEIPASGSPALSHHAAVVLEGRYIVLVGGWDGRARVSDIHVFDTVKNNWLPVKTSGFPAGAGLSSHTATALKNGDILVVGREGSLRIQRRSGNSFIIRGSVAKGSFTYDSNPMGVASRSGHTAVNVGSKLLIIGGRDDHLIETHVKYTGTELSASVIKRLISSSDSFKVCKKPPCGRKHHISVPGPDGILIHGGETFDGRSREPVGEIYLIKFHPHLLIYNLGNTSVGRAGHVATTDGEDIYIQGGIGAKNITS